MAHIIVKNSLSNNKAVLVDVNIKDIVTNTSDGDPIWVMETATTYPSVSGTLIRPVYVANTANFEDVSEVVDYSVSKIAQQIMWGELIEDVDAPYVDYIYPVGSNASIASNIVIDIIDAMPSAGIDLTDVKVILDTEGTSFDITNECSIVGDPTHYTFYWEPKIRVFNTYNGE